MRFNPSLPGLIVGGTVSGKLILWDVKNKLGIDGSVREELKGNFYQVNISFQYL